MNLLTIIVIAAGFVAGWYSCNKKDQVRKWIKDVLKKAHKKADSI